MQRVGHDSVTEHTHAQFVTSKCFKDQRLIYDWLNEHFSSITLKLENDYYDTYKITHSFTREFDALLMNDLEVLVDDTMKASDFTYKARVLDEYEAIDALYNKTNVEIPYPLKGIKDRVIRFEEVIDKTDIIDFIGKKIKEEGYEG